MWWISCILLIMGTVAAVMGISFLIRNREAAGKIRFYIFSYGVCAALWCLNYALIGLSDNMVFCEWLRKFGLLSVELFLVTETFLGTDMSGMDKKRGAFWRIVAILLSVVDFVVFSPSKTITFVRIGSWTTWYSNPEYKVARMVHSIYIVLIFTLLFSLAIAWYRNNKLQRLRRFLAMVFVSNFTMLFFTVPDFLLPAMGKPAVATSGIGAALCAIVMWYGAIQLNSFDIRTGHVKDRLFDFLEAGIIVFDSEHQVALRNHFADKVLGDAAHSKENLLTYFDIELDVGKAMFEEARDRIYTTRMWDKKGVKAYSMRMQAVRDNYGDIFCFMCIFVDVTEEVEAARKLQIASTAKSRFLAQMSHEIRTPINAVLGMNEMILRESDDDDILEYASGIDSAGNTLLALINSILDFSKIEDGKMEIIPVRYDTASFINDLVNSIIQRADAKGLAFKVDVDESLPCALLGDDVRFSQVIMNLLTNAVKYTEKGSVSLTVKERDRDDEKVSIYVSVKDTGIGIRPEDRERLFESFERLDELRNHGIEGTGLGMSIVINLLDLMGSSLSVDSTYGEGSDFSFVIDQVIADPAPMGDYATRFRNSKQQKENDDVIYAPDAKVLLVDDNDMNLKVAKNLLKLCGIVPEMVSSGAAAIGAVRSQKYDIVFLDHMMPGMDGIETLSYMKREKLLTDDTTVIALTANAVVGAREAYLAAGFKDYLSKPIAIKELVEKLRLYLPEDVIKVKEDDSDNTITAADDEWEVMEFDAVEESDEAASDSGALNIEGLKAAGLDTEMAIAYCGDEVEFYAQILDEYQSDYDEKSKAIEDAFAREDWKEYAILVHAAKSVSRTVGAIELSGQALALEEAAENGDVSFINTGHRAFMEKYRQLVEKLRAL